MKINQNEKIRTELFSTIEGFSNDELNTKPSENEWSPMQILEHLYLMEMTVTDRIERELGSQESKQAIWKPIFLTVSRAVKVEAPGRVTPSDNYQTIPQITDKLNESRKRLNELYDRLDHAVLRTKSMKHPVFGNVSLHQWFPFVGLHEKRHVKQLKKSLINIKEKRIID